MSKPVADTIRAGVHASTHDSFGMLLEKYRRRGRVWRIMANICNVVFFEVRR